MAQVRFEVLGEMRALVDGDAVELGSERQQRVLLALLLGGPGGLSVDELADRVWSDRDRPTNPTPVLRTYVNRLRTALAGGDERSKIVTRRAGYALSVQPADVREFDDLVAELRSLDDPAERMERATMALAQWRGRAFAGLDDLDWVQPEAARLEELRLSTIEAELEARLELGRHAAVAGDISPLLEEHPYRESLRRIHMLALYAGGRQADALRSYSSLRDRMVEDLGLDPSPELQDLERRILEHDPTLEQRFGAASVWRHHRRSVVVGAATMVAIVMVAAAVVVTVRRASTDAVDSADRAARSREVLAAAVGVARDDPELAVLLAREAMTLDPDADIPLAVVDVIENALLQDRAVETLRGLDLGHERIRYGDISDDGSLLMIGDHDSFRVIDRTTEDVVRRVAAPEAGWFFWGEFVNDDTAVAVHRHAADSHQTGFFYAGPRRLEGRAGEAAVEVHDIASGEMTEVLLGTCAGNFTAPVGFFDSGRSLVAYVDKEDGPCDDFGRNDVVLLDIATGTERYRASAVEPSRAPGPTMAGGRAVWHDLATGSHVVVDVERGVEVARIEAGEGWARLSPDGDRLAVVADFEGSPTVFDVDSGAPVDRLTGHDGRVTSVWWSPDGSMLHVAGGGALSGWSLDDGELSVQIIDREGELGAAYPNSTGDLAVGVLADTDLFRILDTTLQRSAPGTRGAAFDVGGPVVELAVLDGSIVVSSEANDGTPSVLVRSDDGVVEELVGGASAASSPDAPVLALQQHDGRGEGPLAVIDRRGRTVLELDGVCWSASEGGRPPVCRDDELGLPARATHVTWSPDGRAVAAILTWAGPDFRAQNEIGVWDVETGALERFGPVPVEASRGLAWSGHAGLTLTGGYRIDLEASAVRSDGPTVTAIESGAESSVGGTVGGALVEVGGSRWTTLIEEASEGAIIDVAVVGDTAASLGQDGIVTIADLDARTIRRRLSVRDGSTVVTWIEPGRLAVGHLDGLVTVIEVEDVPLGGLLDRAPTRSLTEAECTIHLRTSCAEWHSFVEAA